MGRKIWREWEGSVEIERGSGDGWWRRVVETGGGDGWWRRVVETGSRDGWWRRVVETGRVDGCETGSVTEEKGNDKSTTGIGTSLTPASRDTEESNKFRDYNQVTTIRSLQSGHYNQVTTIRSLQSGHYNQVTTIRSLQSGHYNRKFVCRNMLFHILQDSHIETK